MFPRFALCCAALLALTLACQREEPPKTPEQVARAYLNAASVRDRLAHVLNPERVSELLIDRGRTLDETLHLGAEGVDLTTEPSDFASLDVGQLITVTTNRKLKDPENNRPIDEFFVFKTPSGYKLDEHATWGRNPITLREFQALDPGTRMYFRVWVKRQPDPYGRADPPQTEDLKLILQFQRGTWTSCYAERTTEAGLFLDRLLTDERSRKVVLEIKLEADYKRQTARVWSLVQEGWAFWDPTDAFMRRRPIHKGIGSDVAGLKIDGDVSQYNLRPKIENRLREFEVCFERALDEDPLLKNGEIVFSFAIGSDGWVGRTEVLSTMFEPTWLNDCARKVVRSWYLIPPDDRKPATVQLTIRVGKTSVE
ncbi:MAG: hypothetical protein JRF63_00010 [Deltaproteobacteria bacterium]|nr:hypothetical protein [Deltaproteobacteria bacterium]